MRVLASEVRTRYGEAAAAIQDLAVLDELVAAVVKQRDLVASRVAAGAAPPVERDLLRVEVGRLRAERLRQSAAVEGALINLKRLLGMPADAPIRLRQALEQLVLQDADVTPPVEGSGTDTRVDVKLAQSRVRVAEAQIERARRDGRFDVSLFGMYMRTDTGFPQRGFTAAGALEPVRGNFHYVAAGASVTLPLRNRNQGAVASAQAQRAGAAAELDAIQLTAQGEVASARVRDDRARQALAIYTTDTRSLARQTLAIVTQTYELGRATVFDVLSEQRRYLEVERACTSALREAYEAREAVRRALGEME
jgi:outer membrane protein, heavy metal efflux system